MSNSVIYERCILNLLFGHLDGNWDLMVPIMSFPTEVTFDHLYFKKWVSPLLMAILVSIFILDDLRKIIKACWSQWSHFPPKLSLIIRRLGNEQLRHRWKVHSQFVFQITWCYTLNLCISPNRVIFIERFIFGHLWSRKQAASSSMEGAMHSQFIFRTTWE